MAEAPGAIAGCFNNAGHGTGCGRSGRQILTGDRHSSQSACDRQLLQDHGDGAAWFPDSRAALAE
jgi:hypothetical protein